MNPHRLSNQALRICRGWSPYTRNYVQTNKGRKAEVAIAADVVGRGRLIGPIENRFTSEPKAEDPP